MQLIRTSGGVIRGSSNSAKMAELSKDMTCQNILHNALDFQAQKENKARYMAALVAGVGQGQ